MEGMTASQYSEEHESELNERRNSYLKSLKKITNVIGMDFKLQESWVSSTLLNYGKEIFTDGSYTCSGIKKISRAYQEVSEIYPSLQSRAAAIYTSAQSTSMKSFESIVPYLIANLDCLNMITKESNNGTTLGESARKFLHSQNVQLDDHIKLVLLLLPRECGGLPTISY